MSVIAFTDDEDRHFHSLMGILLDECLAEDGSHRYQGFDPEVEGHIRAFLNVYSPVYFDSVQTGDRCYC
jgi:hypothetical protein